MQCQEVEGLPGVWCVVVSIFIVFLSAVIDVTIKYLLILLRAS